MIYLFQVMWTVSFYLQIEDIGKEKSVFAKKSSSTINSAENR